VRSDQIEAAINGLRPQQVAKERRWLRGRYVDIAFGLARFFGFILRLAMIGANPASPMILIEVIFMFLEGATLTAGRLRTSFKSFRG
jgi:hypothetical protein